MFVWGGGPSGGFAAAILIWGRQARAGLRPAAPSAGGRSPPPRKLIPEVGAGVDGLPLHHDLVVKVGARGAPGIAGITDHLAPLDPLALLHGGLREVAVERADVLAVVENDRDAVLRLRAGEGDRPFRGGADRRAGLRVDIDAAVELGDPRPRREAVAGLRGDGASPRPAWRKRCHRPSGARPQAVHGAEVLALLRHA